MSKRVGAFLYLLALSVAAIPAQAADIAGRGSIGASAGGMMFLSGEEFGDGQPRPLGQLVFKYNFSQRLAAVLQTGWGWNAYDTSDREDGDTLAVVIPTTLGFEYRFHSGESKLWPHVGAGAGLYSLGVKDSFRTWARGNNGTERLTWTSPGIYGKLGTEILYDNGVSINLDLLYHAIFSKDEERFPDGWGNQNTSFAQVRIGVNYYFTLKRTGPAPPEGD